MVKGIKEGLSHSNLTEALIPRNSTQNHPS